MKRSRFSDEQIIWILKEQESGAVTADVCRRHGISEATFYKWKAKFGGLEVSEAKRLRTLEEENGKLKKLLAARAVSPDRRRLPASRNSFDQAQYRLSAMALRRHRAACFPHREALPGRCGSFPRRNGACARRGEYRGPVFQLAPAWVGRRISGSSSLSLGLR
jgi:putative transposase